MPLRIVFVAFVCLALASLVGFAGFSFIHRFPWLPIVAVLTDIGIVLGGIKTVMDIVKGAADLQKARYDLDKVKADLEVATVVLRKTKLEINQLQRSADREDAHIAKATLAEIKEYGMLSDFPKLSGAAFPNKRIQQVGVDWDEVGSITLMILVLGTSLVGTYTIIRFVILMIRAHI